MTRRRPAWPSEEAPAPRRMSDADDTVTGVAIVRISACHRCGREVTVHLTGAVCACGVVSSLRDREEKP